jgi:hypothetical protein
MINTVESFARLEIWEGESEHVMPLGAEHVNCRYCPDTNVMFGLTWKLVCWPAAIVAEVALAFNTNELELLVVLRLFVSDENPHSSVANVAPDAIPPGGLTVRWNANRNPV